VPWGRVTLPKESGGLGIIDLKLQNQTLLMKWLWLAHQNNKDPSLWNSMLTSIGYTLPIDPTATPQPALSFFIEDITKLKPLLTATTVKDEQGHLIWNLTSTGQFTVKSTYKFLNNPGVPEPNLQKIWSLPLPPR
jgi:hypothetical protein